MIRGFTLLEVIVALVVLEVGMLGVLGTILLASRAMVAAEVVESAVLEAQRVVDSLDTDGLSGAGERPARWGRVSWSESGWVVGLDGAGDTLLRLPTSRSR